MKKPPCILSKESFRRLKCFEKVDKPLKNDEVILVALLRMVFTHIFFKDFINIIAIYKS